MSTPNATDVSAGALLKSPRPGKLLRGHDVAALFAVVNALKNFRCERQDAIADQSGVAHNGAEFHLSAVNAVLSLYDAGTTSADTPTGSSNVIAMQVQSWTPANDYFSAKVYTFTGGATGAAINVALPWELRSAQAPSAAYSVAQPYAASDIVFVMVSPDFGTGVTVSAAELTYLDLGVGRTWIKPSQPQDFTIVSISGDYVTATNNATSVSTNIAKPFKLRNSITTQTIDGTAWSYTYTSTVQRTAAAAGYSEYQRVSERYLVGDIIWADLPSATGVTVSGTPLIWMDTNRDGRQWSAKVDQTTA